MILSVGGFLGLGAKYVSVPFSALRVTEKGDKRYLVIDATKETLTSAPGYQYDKASGKWVPEKRNDNRRRNDSEYRGSLPSGERCGYNDASDHHHCCAACYGWRLVRPRTLVLVPSSYSASDATCVVLNGKTRCR